MDGPQGVSPVCSTYLTFRGSSQKFGTVNRVGSDISLLETSGTLKEISLQVFGGWLLSCRSVKQNMHSFLYSAMRALCIVCCALSFLSMQLFGYLIFDPIHHLFYTTIIPKQYTLKAQESLLSRACTNGSVHGGRHLYCQCDQMLFSWKFPRLRRRLWQPFIIK